MSVSQKPITKGYLKGYYGYKNFGDELLALGLIRYLFKHYPLEVLYIEVDDVDWFSTWLHRHDYYLGDDLCKVKLVSAHDKVRVMQYSILTPSIHKFLGGGEVFAPARGWFHGGRNMYILYWLDFLRGNVTLIGGISQSTTTLFKLLYSLTLPFTKSIILRDIDSYTYVKTSFPKAKNVIQYHDFAYDVVSSPVVSTLTLEETMSLSCLQCPYVLINTNPYVDKQELTEKIYLLTQDDTQKTIVYFYCDEEDKPFYEYISTLNIDNELTQFDWTQHDIRLTKSLFKYVSTSVGVRLHFLSILARMGKSFDFVVYQEKIEKFLRNVGEYEKIS